jgi:two-component sensor histidine kinase
LARPFSGRIQALSRAHDIALKGGFQRIALGGIVHQALEPFRTDGRIEIVEGPLVELESVASQALTLTLHELATNALKYGALSNSVGTVSIDWRIKANGGDPRVLFTWSESGGPEVDRARPGRPANALHQSSVRYDLQGDVALDFRPEGLRATIDFPLKKKATVTNVVKPGEAPPNANR